MTVACWSIMLAFFSFTALLALCCGSPQFGFLGDIAGQIFGGDDDNNNGNQGNGGHSGQTRPSQGGSNCPLACPPGWVRFALSEHCYKLPAQPAHLNTFWEWDRRCKAMEPTSYIAVSSSIAEQAVGSAVAIQYAPTWFAGLTNAFLWLGGYTDHTGWKFLDGTDQSGSILFLGAGIASLFSKPNDTCLGADPYTLGVWQTYPCSNKRGSAFCEMAMRPVCGPTGSILPISPISTDPESLFNLFPGMPKIPYISQLLGGSAFDNALTDVGNSIKCYVTGRCGGSGGSGSRPRPLPQGCSYGCPDGWYSFDRSPTSQCYKLAPHNLARRQGYRVRRLTFWEAQADCRRSDSTSYVLVLNSLLELMMTKAVLEQFKWNVANKDAYLWLGAYVQSGRWNYLDRSEENGHLLMSLANPNARLPGRFRNNTCMAADLKNGGNWKEVPCNQANGLYFCEMQKKQYCDRRRHGGDLSFRQLDLSVRMVRAMFPKMPQVPFLEEVLQGKGQQESINPNQIQQNMAASSMVFGAGTASIICVRAGQSRPQWEYLKIRNEVAIIYGSWSRISCQSSSSAFEASSAAVLSAWSRCYNKGYELAMPVWRPFSSKFLNDFVSAFSGWYPFQVGDKISEFYANTQAGGWPLSGLIGNVIGGYSKIPQSRIPNC